MLAALTALLVAAPGVSAQDDPFKGPTKVVEGPEGRVKITVPVRWREESISGNIVLRVRAPHSGGHDIIVTRETGQSDVDAQRDRYLTYDSGKYAGAEVKKLAEPFYGYRLNAPSKNVVIFRRFITDGDDGLVIVSSSRLKMFDQVYKEQLFAVLASIEVAGRAGGAATSSAEEGGERRVFDPAAVVSLVAPAAWKSLAPDPDEKEVLTLGLKGSRSGPVIRMLDMGSPTNANLVLSKVSGQWKSYGSVVFKRFPGKPPRMMCANRKPGWIDYVIAYDANGHGYALHLTVREGSFEKFRAITDAIGSTVVFTDGDYAPPKSPPGEVHDEVRKAFVVHAKAEQAGMIPAVVKLLRGFEKDWRRVGLGDSRKAPPIHILVTTDDAFADASHGFGKRPAAYDRSTCMVVVAPQPDDRALHDGWRGGIYAALAEASLHRDMPGKVPPWLRTGLAACMEAAGRSGKGPDEPHPAYVKILDNSAATQLLTPLPDVLKRTNADYFMAEKLDGHAMAWGYTHLALFGSGTLPGIYRKWKKAAERARRDAPPFDLGDYTGGVADLTKHIERELTR
jgi:hypothetical protein